MANHCKGIFIWNAMTEDYNIHIKELHTTEHAPTGANSCWRVKCLFFQASSALGSIISHAWLCTWLLSASCPSPTQICSNHVHSALLLIQSSHPLSVLLPPTFSTFHQVPFQWVTSLSLWHKVLQSQSSSWSFSFRSLSSWHSLPAQSLQQGQEAWHASPWSGKSQTCLSDHTIPPQVSPHPSQDWKWSCHSCHIRIIWSISRGK